MKCRKAVNQWGGVAIEGTRFSELIEKKDELWAM